ncbi:hypothetical protein AMATHDRAFT_155477, partial [Amanita thiersii Skay4041]
DVVHVDAHPTLSDFIPEDIIHHGLELSQPEEHYEWFEESPIGSKCGLPLISFLDPYIIIAPSYIHLREIFCLR